MAIKNQALTINFYAFDTDNNVGKTGDSGNFTLRLIKDGGAAAAPDNAGSITEPDSTNMPGIYEIALTAEEMNANFITFHGKSSTADITIAPIFFQTERGDLATVDTVVDAIKAVTDNLPNSGALSDIDTGVNNIEAKLPTNEIMGSSDKADNDTVIDAILTDTGTTLPATLTTIEGKIDTVDTNVDSILVDTGEIGTAGAGLTDLGGMSTAMKAEVNVEAKDIFYTDTLTELSQAAPGKEPTPADGLMLLYMALRNKLTATATEQGIYNDAGTKIAKAVLSDDGTTFTKAEFGSGA